ncbi:HD domain-containing protein [Bifidobacterium cuniculi]|uniref:Metal-dependent hydrolase n=1 Tax=Bifidobacterium cuniculi TaxID=1688 RepID=A0A087AQC0_9BIFI|nr:HD domain-containing protein [Bifidobacterium cuniculi]KFI60970.1 metal-dependent hydrolase [Bifidobacterium cuniculi]
MLDRQAISRIVRHVGADILAHGHMQLEREAYQHGAVTTYEHSVRVAELAVWLADRLHLWHRVDLRSLVRAALLHDYFLYDWHERGDGSHRLHGFRHPARAERNARADFDLNDVEADSIRRHMFPLTPIPPRYLEGVLVNVADKISATAETLSPQRFSRHRSGSRR